MAIEYRQLRNDVIDSTRVLLRGNGDFTTEQFMQVMSARNEQRMMLSLGLTTGPNCNMRCVYCYSEGGTREAGRSIGSVFSNVLALKKLVE